ncbi:MAG TPA: DmsE family decaheme c-type cytochrome [Thermoanaerobaculia bacterium]|nr:DmsE family decaheme c-type cytochrome [Thermoanaerobaculia bacterium]
MSMTPKATGRLAILLVLAVAAPWTAPVAQEPPAQQPPPVQELPAQGAPAQDPPAEPMPEAAPEPATMSCGDCHDLAQKFLLNPHARGGVENGVVANGTCETCHGDGTAHIEAGGDPTLIQVPRGRAGADDVCMMCHDAATDQKSHRAGVHANSAAVNCLSCHSIHKSEERPALLAAEDPKLCATCHSTQVASFRSKPFTHRLGTGTMGCSTCHEPHGFDARQNVRRTAAGEQACAACHQEKHGPFVFEHGAMAAGDCMSCHDPHGSTNPHQLKRATAVQLCLECHSPTTHGTAGSQPPSFHNINNPRFQNCTTCHVAIHGSNRSPQLLK